MGGVTKTDNTYDRIIVTNDTFNSEYIQGSAGVFEFDRALGITDEDMVFDVSDHYPVSADYDITLPDDD